MVNPILSIVDVPPLDIGTTLSMSHIEPFTQTKIDQIASQKIHTLLNRLFLEPSLGLGYPVKDLPFLKKVEKYLIQGDEKRMEFDFDFIGIQNYTREIVKSNWYTPYVKASIVPAKTRNVSITAMDWEIYPAALYQVLKFAASYDKVKNIIVSENGVAFNESETHTGESDDKRIEFLKQNVYQLQKALSETDKIKGYFCLELIG